MNFFCSREIHETLEAMKNFSAHLFWDTPRENVDPATHRNWLVKRVLEKGFFNDWKLLLELFEKDELREALRELRDLEGRALSFACAVLDLDQTQLRCYKNRLSQSTPWSY